MYNPPPLKTRPWTIPTVMLSSHIAQYPGLTLAQGASHYYNYNITKSLLTLMNVVHLHREKYNKLECSADRFEKVESEITLGSIEPICYLRSVLQAAQTKMPSLPARHPFYTG
jgi:hypothetical protein